MSIYDFDICFEYTGSYALLVRTLIEKLPSFFNIKQVDLQLKENTMHGISTKECLNLVGSEFDNCFFVIDKALEDGSIMRFGLFIEPSTGLVVLNCNSIRREYVNSFLDILESLMAIIKPFNVYKSYDCENLKTVMNTTTPNEIILDFEYTIDLSKQIKKIVEKYRKKGDEGLAEQKK